MTTHLVTLSTEDMRRSAQLCTESAHRFGVNKTILWMHGAMKQTEFYAANAPLIDQPRGGGYWAWKPWVILNALIDDKYNERGEGDILIWADAGIEFIDNVNHIIDRMDQDIFLFGNQWEHAHWCKRDIVEAVWPTANDFSTAPNLSTAEWVNAFDNDLLTRTRFGKQVQASVIFFRVNDKTRAFVKEWLDWCLFEGGRLIDDSPSRTPNHPEFRENRHDQAILTTMAYRDGIKLHWWPAMYNDGAFIYERGDYPDEGYPVLFHHHRKRNHEWEQVA